MPMGYLRAPWVLVFAAWLTGCGNGGTPASGPGPVARLEVTPAAVVLRSASETMALKVRGFDARGVEILGLAPVFASSRAAEVAVSGGGVVSALGATGSALIAVRVGEIEAPPVTALVVRLKDGVTPIPDDQIATAPVRLSSSTPASDQIRFALRGAPPISTGALLVGTGSTALAGRVLGVRPAGGDTEVDLELLPTTALVQDLSIDLRFSPQQVQWQRQAPGSTQRVGAVRGIVNSVKPLGAFACRSEADLAPMTGEFEATLTPPQVGFSIVDKIVDGRRVASEVMAEGTVQAKAKAVFRLGAAVAGAITCDLDFGRLTLPVAGLGSIVAAPSLPLRFTSQLAGAVSVAAFTFGVEGTLTATLKLGLRMPEGSDAIEGFKTFDVTHDLTRTVTFPTDAGIRAKAALFFGLGSGLDLSFGNVGTTALASWNLIKLEAGPEFELKTGSPYEVAIDGIYNSEYELRFKLAASPGATIESAIEHFFLSGKAVDLTAKIEAPLARSPQSRAVKVDRASFKAGDTLNFTVALDPANVAFPGVGYNLSEVRIYRLSQDTPTGAELIASMPAQAGQLEFALAWMATGPGEVVDAYTARSNFHAYFVDVPFSTLSGVFPFELGPAVPTVRNLDGAGLTWAPVGIPTTAGAVLFEVAFAGETVAVATGTPTIRSTDAGLSWSPVALPSGVSSLSRVAFGDALHGVASGGGFLLTTADAGATWVVTGVDTIGCYSMRYVAPDTILANDFYGATLRSADGGRTWREGNAGGGAGFIMNNFDTDGHGVVVGSNGSNALWHSFDGGDSWLSARVAQDTKYVTLREVIGGVGFVGGKTFMIGSAGGFLRSTDQGITWTKIAANGGPTPLSDSLGRPSFADATTGVAAFCRLKYGGGTVVRTCGLVRTTDGGLTWSEVPGTDALVKTMSSNIAFSSAGVGLAVTQEWFQGIGDVYGISRSVPR